MRCKSLLLVKAQKETQVIASHRIKYVSRREANMFLHEKQIYASRGCKKKVTQKSLFFPFSVLLTEASMCLLEKKSRKKRDHNFFHFRGCFLCMKNCASSRIKYVLLVEAKNYHNFLFPFSRSTRQSKSVSPREGNLCFSWRHI